MIASGAGERKKEFLRLKTRCEILRPTRESKLIKRRPASRHIRGASGELRILAQLVVPGWIKFWLGQIRRSRVRYVNRQFFFRRRRGVRSCFRHNNSVNEFCVNDDAGFTIIIHSTSFANGARSEPNSGRYQTIKSRAIIRGCVVIEIDGTGEVCCGREGIPIHQV
jgi:hypothetical protein